MLDGDLKPGDRLIWTASHAANRVVLEIISIEETHDGIWITLTDQTVKYYYTESRVRENCVRE